MPIRITGMNSGLDTEALVSELVSAYRKKTEKYVKAQTKLTWKQNAWKSMSAKTYSFRSSMDSMRLSSYYKLKTTSVSNTTKATVKASNDAVNGSQSLNVVNLAKAGYLTGGKLKSADGRSVTGSATLDSLTYGSGAGSSVAGGKIQVNGREIELNDGMTINGVVSELQKAGVTASFDEKNQRIFISSKQSGAASDFTLAAMNDEGKEALKKLGIYAQSEATDALYQKYAAIQKEFETYCTDNGITNPSAADRTNWITDQLERYNNDSETISKANTAEGYLNKAADYAKALETLNSVEKEFRDAGIDVDKAKELLEDSSKFVAGNGDVYTFESDVSGSYYLKEGDTTTKYYLDTKTNPDGSTVTVMRDAPVGQAAGVETEVSTADTYLKDTLNVTDKQRQDYRSALSGKKTFEDAVKAEQTERLNTWTAELKAKAMAEFADAHGGTQPTAAEEQAIEQQAKTDAEAKLKAEKAYNGADIDINSLTAVQAKYFNGGQPMSAAEVEAAVKAVDVALNGDPSDPSAPAGIRAERKTAQSFVDDHAFMASYAREYAAAADPNSNVTQAAVVESMEKDLDHALKELGARATGASDYSEGAVRVNGQDATIYLNGAEYTSDSNTFNINGLTITALATTVSADVADKLLNGTDDEKAAALSALDSSAITITTATDNQGIYDKIKDFLGNYNNLINLMTASYNAESAKDYEPLTDEERQAMTESQIEKWEEKGKSDVLRRDGTLSALMSTLTAAMSRSYEINGKKYSLSTFGIKTLGILNAEKNEHNAYHIDGDADDESVSANSDKLMAAITEDPDAVAEFFQLLTHDLSMDLNRKMTSTTMRTYGTFYNDKEMAKEYSDYTTTIAKWEEKVTKIEDSYYKKFAAMEKALATLQSQSSQLAGLLG